MVKYMSLKLFTHTFFPRFPLPNPIYFFQSTLSGATQIHGHVNLTLPSLSSGTNFEFLTSFSLVTSMGYGQGHGSKMFLLSFATQIHAHVGSTLSALTSGTNFVFLISFFTVTLKGHGQGHGSKILPNCLKMLYLTNKLENSYADWKKSKWGLEKGNGGKRTK